MRFPSQVSTSGGGVVGYPSSGGGSLRARLLSSSVPLSSGVVAAVGSLGLLAPIVYNKTGGNANLTVNLSTGAVSATAALTAGQQQVISGTATGADGVVLPWTDTLTGVVSAPAIVASFTVTPGNTQNSIAWTDGSNGGSAITGHNLYKSLTAGFTPAPGNLVGTIVGASPYVDTGLTNDVPVYYQIAAVNAVGEGTLSGQQTGTPASAPALVTAPDQFTDDFTGITTGTALWTLSGWGAWTYVGSPNPALKATFRTTAANTAGPTGTWDATSPLGIYLVGRDVPWTGGQSLAFTYISGFTAGVFLMATDNGNGILVTLTLNGHAYTVYDVVAGVATQKYTSTFTATDWVSGDRFEVRATVIGSDTQVRCFRNNKPLTGTVSTPAMVLMGKTYAGTKMGIQNYSAGQDSYYDNFAWNSLTGAFTVTEDPAAAYASDLNSSNQPTGRDITASGTYALFATAPVGIAYRARNKTTGTLTVAATRMTGVTIGSGAWSGTYRLPFGDSVQVEFGPVAADGTIAYWTPMIATKAVAFTALMYGQSEAVDLSSSSNVSNNTPVSSRVFINGAQLFVAGTAPFAQTSAVNGYDWERLATALGGPVLITGGGTAGSSLSHLVPGSPTVFADPNFGGASRNAYSALTANLVTLGAIGKVGLIVFDQGFGDISSPGAGAAWASVAPGLFTSMRTDFAGGRNIPVLLDIEGRLDSGQATTAVDIEMTAVRQSQVSVINAGYASYGAHSSGLTLNMDPWGLNNTDAHCCRQGTLSPTGGNTTANQNGIRNKQRRLAMNARVALGYAGPDGQGPLPLALTRTAGVVRLTLNKNGADTVVIPATVDSVEISTASNFSSLLTINSTTSGVDGSSNPYVEWTLSTNPGVPVYLRTYAKTTPLDASRIEGQYTADGITIAMRPVIAPMVSPT